MIIDKLIERIIETQNPTCVGLDTAFDYLPDDMREMVEEDKRSIDKLRGGIAELNKAISELGIKANVDFDNVSYDDVMASQIFLFNQKIIDAICDIVPAVKVQMAYYEELGSEGIRCFFDTVCYARSKGLIVIADCKRNDIGSTAARYSAAYFNKNKNCDFLTVNGYLGSDGIAPFVEDSKKNDKGIFVLVKTSNPSSGELQDLRLEDGRTVYECMGDMVEAWGEDNRGIYGYSRVGAVVGATHPEEAAVLRKRLPHTFFLIPGYGAQGGNAQMLKNSFHPHGMGGIVNNSRGILCAYKKRGGTFDEAARQACLDMKADLLSVLGEICAK